MMTILVIIVLIAMGLAVINYRISAKLYEELARLTIIIEDRVTKQTTALDRAKEHKIEYRNKTLNY